MYDIQINAMFEFSKFFSQNYTEARKNLFTQIKTFPLKHTKSFVAITQESLTWTPEIFFNLSLKRKIKKNIFIFIFFCEKITRNRRLQLSYSGKSYMSFRNIFLFMYEEKKTVFIFLFRKRVARKIVLRNHGWATRRISWWIHGIMYRLQNGFRKFHKKFWSAIPEKCPADCETWDPKVLEKTS